MITEQTRDSSGSTHPVSTFTLTWLSPWGGVLSPSSLAEALVSCWFWEHSQEKKQLFLDVERQVESLMGFPPGRTHSCSHHQEESWKDPTIIPVPVFCATTALTRCPILFMGSRLPSSGNPAPSQYSLFFASSLWLIQISSCHLSL